MTDWKWENPELLFLIPFVFLFGFFVLKSYFRRSKRVQNIFGQKVFEFLTATNSIRNFKIKIFCEVLALTFFISTSIWSEQLRNQKPGSGTTSSF